MNIKLTDKQKKEIRKITSDIENAGYVYGDNTGSFEGLIDAQRGYEKIIAIIESKE